MTIIQGKWMSPATIKNNPSTNFFTQYGWVILYILGALYYAHCKIIISHDDMLHYFGISAYMNNSHQYLYTSNYAGNLYTEKPPLFFWTIALGWRLFGIHYWWPQLLSAFFILSWIFFAKLIYQRIFPNDSKGSQLLPWVFTASVGGINYLSAYRVDWIMTSASLLFFYSYLCLYLKEGRYNDRTFWYKCSITLSTAMGLMCKGPLIFLFTLMPCLTHLAFEKKWNKAMTSAFLFSAIGTCLVTAFWLIPVYLHAPVQYWHNTISHLASHHSKQSWHFILMKRVFLFYLSPWIGMALAFSCLINTTKQFYNTTPFWSFLIPPSAVFIIHGGFEWYLLPIMPLCFVFLTRLLSSNTNNTLIKNILFISFSILFFSVACLIIYKIFFSLNNSHFLFQGKLPPLPFISIALLCTLAAVILIKKRETIFNFLPAYASLFFICYVSLQGYGSEKINTNSNLKLMLNKTTHHLTTKQGVGFYSSAGAIVSAISLVELKLKHNLPIISPLSLHSFKNQHPNALLFTFNNIQTPCPEGFKPSIILPRYKPYAQGQINLCKAR